MYALVLVVLLSPIGLALAAASFWFIGYRQRDNLIDRKSARPWYIAAAISTTMSMGLAAFIYHVLHEISRRGWF